MQEEGTADVVFFDGSVRQPSDFVEMFKNSGARLFVARIDDQDVGILYLTDFDYRTAVIHFCVFKEWWGNPVVKDLARFCLEEILSWEDAAGRPIFDALIGRTPSSNTHAIKFLQSVGLKTVGEIPKLFWSYKDQRSIDGTISYITRGTE